MDRFAEEIRAFGMVLIAAAFLWLVLVLHGFVKPAYQIADALDRIAQAEHIKVAGRDIVKEVFNRRDLP